PGVFAFVALVRGARPPGGVSPLLVFQEQEGTTLVLDEAEAARARFSILFRARLITLEVQSSLEAVGFLAALLPPLAAAGISVNSVSAAFHDHLFVPVDRADDALRILEALARAQAAQTPR
ncbi:MAG: ACT domain-containing protein, partial [Parvularculaceae bacterium]|nr:ACT domain-containing protein [Parvularculaceae bacterium]